MASRKQLKKSIKHICGELFADCVALRMCEAADEKQLDDLMVRTMGLYYECVARINHTEKGNEKIFYKKLRADFTSEANAISEAIVKA